MEVEGKDAEIEAPPVPVRARTTEEMFASMLASQEEQRALLMALMGSQQTLDSKIETTNSRIEDLEVKTANQVQVMEGNISRAEDDFGRMSAEVDGGQRDRRSRRESLDFPLRMPSVEPRAGTVVIHVPYKIPPGDLLMKVSYKSYMLLNRLLRNAIAESKDNSLTKVQFTTEKVRREMVQWARLHEFPGCSLMNYTSIFEMSNGDFDRLFAAMLRPTSQVQHQKQLMGNIDPPKPTYSSWNWGIVNYDTALYPAIERTIFAMEELNEIMEEGATAKERLNMLPIKFGKRDDPGVLDTLMQNLGTYVSEFERGVGGISKLKECKTVMDLFVLLRKANMELAQASVSHSQMMAKFAPIPRSEEVYQAIRDRESSDRRDKDRDNHRDRDSRRDRDRDGGGSQAVRDREQQRKFREGKGEHAINLLSREQVQFEDDQLQFDAEAGGFPDNVSENDFPQSQVLAFQTPPPRPADGHLVSTNPRKKGPNLCWAFYRTGVCSSGATCPFNHKKEDHIDFALQREKELAASPWRPSAIEAKLVAGKSQDVRQQTGGGPYAKVHTMEDEDEAEYFTGLGHRQLI
jgi:hypothetical protein